MFALERPVFQHVPWILTTRTGHPEPMVPGTFLVGRCPRRTGPEGMCLSERSFAILLSLSFAQIREKHPPRDSLPRLSVFPKGIKDTRPPPHPSTLSTDLWATPPLCRWTRILGRSQFRNPAPAVKCRRMTTATIAATTAQSRAPKRSPTSSTRYRISTEGNLPLLAHGPQAGEPAPGRPLLGLLWLHVSEQNEPFPQLMK
jgi:hypothetical protein